MGSKLGVVAEKRVLVNLMVVEQKYPWRVASPVTGPHNFIMIQTS